MHTYIVVLAGDLYHICYQIPGTLVFTSYETSTSKKMAEARADEMNHRVKVGDFTQEF